MPGTVRGRSRSSARNRDEVARLSDHEFEPTRPLRHVASARFEVVNGIQNVPVGDNLGTFESERYFDGYRVRTQASADELAVHYLQPLGLDSSMCWVTDLVKVFLFKPGHRAKYEKLKAPLPPGYERERFEQLAFSSLPWLERELTVARPHLLLTLGSEVAGIVRGLSGQRRRNTLLGPTISVLTVGAIDVPTVHLAHPGIVMRGNGGGRNPWPAAHEAHIAELRPLMADEPVHTHT